MTDRLFRYSQTSTFMQSRTKYWLKYILGVQKKYPDPQRPVLASDIGTVGHRGLEAVYKNHKMDFARAAMRSKARRLGVYDTDKLQIAMGYEAFERHVAWVNESKIDEGLETVAVEKRLYHEMGSVLGDSVVLTCAPDLVQRDRFGSLIVDDWKFVTDYDRLGTFVDANRQGLTYAFMCEQVYGSLPIKFVLRQTHRKPPKTKTYIVSQTETQWIKPDVVERHMVRLRRMVEDMVRLHQETEAGDFSGLYSEPTQCSQYGPCTDYEICCGGITKSPEEIAEIIRNSYEINEERL